ncbi:MAG: hypothetical protein KDK39_15155 [Leptospiraceae bacterium]|nr:hypothetical protein [Leptospiraceae bacterium]
MTHTRQQATRAVHFILVSGLLFSSLAGGLVAQITKREVLPGMVDIQKREAGSGIGGQYYDHRFRILLGFGRGNNLPAVLSEAGPAWMTNSFVGYFQNVNNSPVIQLSDPAKLKHWSGRLEMDYTWLDRIQGGISYYNINQEYNRNEPARIDFFHPASDIKRWSYFEGVRLTKYNEERKNIFVRYLHPVDFDDFQVQGLRIGLYASRELVDERNEISFGSYVATTNTSTIAPGTISWSQGGVVPVVYDLKGYSIGPAVRYQLFDWLGLHYRFTPVRRSGPMNMFGVRTIQQTTDATGASVVGALIPFGTAEVQDSGVRHNFEAVARIYCRYTLHLGIMKEDIDRSYSFYLAKTVATDANLPFQEKTPSIFGLGEMSSSHKMEKLEVYLKFGTALFW